MLAGEERTVQARAKDSVSDSASALLPALAWYSLLLLSSLLPQFSALHRTGSATHTPPFPPRVCMRVEETKRKREVGKGSGGHANSYMCVCNHNVRNSTPPETQRAMAAQQLQLIVLQLCSTVAAQLRDTEREREWGGIDKKVEFTSLVSREG